MLSSDAPMIPARYMTPLLTHWRRKCCDKVGTKSLAPFCSHWLWAKCFEESCVLGTVQATAKASWCLWNKALEASNMASIEALLLLQGFPPNLGYSERNTQERQQISFNIPRATRKWLEFRNFAWFRALTNDILRLFGVTTKGPVTLGIKISCKVELYRTTSRNFSKRKQTDHWRKLWATSWIVRCFPLAMRDVSQQVLLEGDLASSNTAALRQRTVLQLNLKTWAVTTLMVCNFWTFSRRESFAMHSLPEWHALSILAEGL